MSHITAYCKINGSSCSVNGKQVLSYDTEQSSSWLKQLYKAAFPEAYPKYFKMDRPSKIAMVAVEFLKQADPTIAERTDDEIAVIAASSHSSADTDLAFQASYTTDVAPSPALFVYTLPNILIGEIAIRNKWYGENLCIVMSEFDQERALQQVELQLANGSNACLLAWVNVLGDELEAFCCFVARTGTDQLNLPFTTSTLHNLYHL